MDALLRELVNRADEVSGSLISTVYLGGGTPSVLSHRHIEKIMTRVAELYEIDTAAEVTIEANPDDLDDARLKILKTTGINRLSIGVQSFHSTHLERMRRSHLAEEAVDAIQRTAAHGFDNINIDLIYGLPGLKNTEWQQDLYTTMDLPVQHISAYHLTYEPGTVFNHWKKKGKIRELPEEKSIEQYNMLREITSTHGFEHYEISNFALPGFRSKHNSSYWSGTPYVGFGPSAHSFNGKERRWNLASLKAYIENSTPGLSGFEKEVLTSRDRYHDYLITALRTKEGADLGMIRDQFGKLVADQLTVKVLPFTASGEIEMEGDELRMTPQGWLRSDLVLQALMEE